MAKITSDSSVQTIVLLFCKLKILIQWTSVIQLRDDYCTTYKQQNSFLEWIMCTLPENINHTQDWGDIYVPICPFDCHINVP